MSLADRLRLIISALPPSASVTIRVEDLQAWLDAESVPGRTSLAAHVDLTVDQFAAELNRAPSTVRGWCAAGQVSGAYRLHGREWRIPRASLSGLSDRPKGPRWRNDRPVGLDEWRQHVAT